MRHGNIAVFVPHAGCRHMCSFCNQKIISGESSQPTALEVQKILLAAEAQMNREERQLAFFGGSFTAIDRDYMLSLLEAAKPFVDSGFLNCGIRVSTRPDAIDAEVCSLLQSYGVRAVELGAQSTDDGVLKMNSRGHTARQIFDAAATIAGCGLETGLQMMTGLYGATDETDLKTARDIILMKPQTVRIYPTVVLGGTRLDELMRAGEYTPPSFESQTELCATLIELFGSCGIDVIRVGLHASADVEQSMTGGTYHPALREICESRIFYRRAVEALERSGLKKADLYVDKKNISKMTGQHRENLERLKAMGYSCTVSAREGLGELEVTVGA